MKARLAILHRIFIIMPTWLFIPIMVFNMYFIIIVAEPVIMLLVRLTGELGGPSALYKINRYIALLFGAIVVPIAETLIFQFGIIKLTRRSNYLREHAGLQIFISAAVFGIFHWYSVTYMFVGFLGGLILAYSYMIFEYKKLNPLWYVACIHGLRNLITLIDSLFI